MAVWERVVVPNLNDSTGIYKNEDCGNSTAEELPRAKRMKEDSETESMDKQIDASYSGICTSYHYLVIGWYVY